MSFYYPYSASSNPTVVQALGSGSVTATYHPSTYLKFTVSSSQDISFTITLSNGMSWSGNTLTASSYTFYLPYGTYSWSISPVEYNGSIHGVPIHYIATPSSGSATTNDTIAINYVRKNSAFEYTWYETGLPSGTQWSVTVNGNTYTSTGTSLSEWFSSGQTYFWNASASGYTASPSTGTFHASGSTTITFYKKLTVSLSANPTSGQEPITVTYTATVTGSSSAIFAYVYMNPYNPTYWSVSNVVYNGVTYYPSPQSGEYTMSNTGAYVTFSTTPNEPITFNIDMQSFPGLVGEWELYTQVPGEPYEGISPTASGWGSGQVQVEWATGSYMSWYITVSMWQGSLFLYVPNPWSGSALSGSTVNIVISPYFTETFQEQGLPAGSWSVTVNGQTYSASAGQNIVVTVPVGTYSWSAPRIWVGGNRCYSAYYVPSPGSGTVSGATTISITYNYETVGHCWWRRWYPW